LSRLKDEPATLIFYEAPHRVMETLADIEELLGDRPMAIARELTKVHEEFVRGTAAELRRAHLRLKGEFTLLIGKARKLEVHDGRTIPEAVDARMAAGMSRTEAMKAVARERGLSKRDVYRELEEAGG